MRVWVVLFLSLVFLLTSGLGTFAANNIKVRIEAGGNTIFNSTVETSSCTITDDQGKSHSIDNPAAVCALDSASKVGGFGYDIESQSLGLFLKSISGVGGNWFFWVNRGFSPVGIGNYALNSGDSLVFNQGSSSYPEEKVITPSVESKPAETAQQPSQPVVSEPKQPEKPIETKPAEQPKPPENSTVSNQNTQPQNPQQPVNQTPQNTTPAKQETAPPKANTESKPAPQGGANPPIAQAPAQPAVVNPTSPPPSPSPTGQPSPSPVTNTSTNPQSEKKTDAPASPSPSPTSQPQTRPEVVLIANSGPSRSVTASKSLPQSGPEGMLLLIGPGSTLAGFVFRSKTKHPLARLLKPVKSDKRWYYH